MRTNIALNSFRASLRQASKSSDGKLGDCVAALMATTGIALSSFSLKQMLNNSKTKF